MRSQGESDEAYAARLNDAGVVAIAAGQPKRAEAAFSQALEVRSRWYARAAENRQLAAIRFHLQLLQWKDRRAA